MPPDTEVVFNNFRLFTCDLENLKERKHLEDLELDGSTDLLLISENMAQVKDGWRDFVNTLANASF